MLHIAIYGNIWPYMPIIRYNMAIYTPIYCHNMPYMVLIFRNMTMHAQIMASFAK